MRLSPSLHFILLVVLAPPALADKPPVISGDQRFGDKMSNADRGELLLSELNCHSCHASQHSWTVPPRAAPDLTSVGSRVRVDYMRRFLSNPAAVKPGTTMPHLAGVPQEDQEAIVHFLASTGSVFDQAAGSRRIRDGEILFHQVGCVACHHPQDQTSDDSDPTEEDPDDGTLPQREISDEWMSLADSIPFPKLEEKYTLTSLATFLQDPLAVRRSGRMPHLNLKGDEATKIAAYLLRDLQIPANVTFEYFEGNWDRLPDFDKLNPQDDGDCVGFDISGGLGRDHFGFRFRSHLKIDEAGDYRFHLGSDDGSRLRIDGKVIVENDGVHGVQFKSESVRLEKGEYPIVVEFFEKGGGEELKVEFEGPGIKRQSIERALFNPAARQAAESETFEVDPRLASRGKQQFIAHRCAQCHQMGDVKADRASRPMAELNPNHGCLADQPPVNVPNYHFSTAQRKALAAAISARRSPQTTRGMKEKVTFAMTALNCYACHRRDQTGGVTRVRQAWFQSNQKEMGDEGRIPPELTGIGDKLNRDWLVRVMEQGTKDRFYMHTRMPRFGRENVGEVVDWLTELDEVTSELPALGEITPRRFKADGRMLVGNKGFSCVKCHRFANLDAEGIQAINLTSMTQRLRKNWFHRYMLDPQQSRPGTRMPSSWPRGQVLLPHILDGRATAQIEAIWQYLADGDRAARPLGVGKNPIELVATDRPLIYRNFIEGAGTRAIGVAYPEQVNQAFDANDLRLAMVWHGAFIDASRHWTGRGQGFQPPLGDNVLALPEGITFAQLPDANASWPKDKARDLPGYRFLGYRLDEQRRPTFLYQAAGLSVTDQLVPLSDARFTPISREITLRSSRPLQLAARFAVADDIKRTDANTYLIDNTWTLQLTLPDVAKARIRQQGKTQELIVDLSVPDSGTPWLMKLKYQW